MDRKEAQNKRKGRKNSAEGFLSYGKFLKKLSQPDPPKNKLANTKDKNKLQGKSRKIPEKIPGSNLRQYSKRLYSPETRSLRPEIRTSYNEINVNLPSK
ncbi:hypothetical protein [Leptospira gomenensis]|uniref:hypothetical protein n=1 Tax=Leptospira gomenensis TaxID=2484974 RepID=UPI0014383437|nr:hypothetical protein [Leptospira gomenensis]